jgi:hypothetical protein
MGNGGRSDAPRNDFRAAAPVSNQNNAQLDALSAKLDRIISLLEPKSAKPVATPSVIEEVKEVKTPSVKKAVKKAPVKK